MFRDPDSEKKAQPPEKEAQDQATPPSPDANAEPVGLHPLYEQCKSEGRFDAFYHGCTDDQLVTTEKLVSDYVGVVSAWKDNVFKRLEDPHFREKFFKRYYSHLGKSPVDGDSGGGSG